MLSTHIPTFAVAVALALAMTIASTSHAGSKPAQAQNGIITTGAPAYSGGGVNYTFALTTITNGTLTVTGSIKLDKWKAEFPDFTSTPAVGSTVIAGPYVNIPTNVQGNAVMKLVVKFNKKTITKRSVLVTIMAPPPPPSGPTNVSLMDVGFENLITLDGTKVVTAGLGTPLTYSWTQTAGMPTDLSATDAAMPTFTTGHLTNFVDMAEHFGNIDGIGLDAEQVTESTYKFQVVVTGNSLSRTGVYTVVCASASPKQPNVPVGLLAYFKADTNSTDWTLVSKPIDSAATLMNATSLTPALRPDVEGTYVIKDNVTGQVRTNTAASWTGVEFCNICHGPNNDIGLKDMVTPWSKTGHATFMKEMINGEHGTYYKESCIGCHSAGYDKTPSANNGGFDDIAAATGWMFPSSINSNNWDSMPIDLKRAANIQCESCHGPGSRHPGETSVSLNVAVCAQCHQDGHYHTRVEQWELSPHYKGFKEVSEEEGDNASCARCHAPEGYVDVAKRVANGQNIVTASATNNYATGSGELICQGCHDPHHTFDNPERHQLRFFDEVVIGAPAAAGSVVLTNVGASATCMYCHNSRRFPFQLSNPTNSASQYYKSARSGNLSGPHESPVAEVFNGLGAVTYNVPMGNTFHTYAEEGCIACHMYPNPGFGQAGHNKVGDHTFNMSYLDGTNHVENIAACNQCHAGDFAVDKFDFKSAAAKDWDGSGTTDGIQTETQGLLDRVRVLMETTGMIANTNADGAYISFKTNGLSAVATIKDAQQKSAWNWALINRDHSKGVHNPLFTIRLLQTTYTDLSTNYHGDTTRTFTNEFPNAVLR
jgi:hypothetical protein